MDLLTGPKVVSLFERMIAPGETLKTWRVHSVHHRPGAGVSIGYAVSTSRKERYLVASTARLTGADVTVWEQAGRRVCAWEYPHDPELPGLPVAASAQSMSALVGRAASVELLNYRPTRRAVVKVRTKDGAVYFGKVLRPSQAAELVRRHRVLLEAGVPVPRLIVDDDRGIVVTAAVPGEPLANVISRGMGSRAREIFRSLTRELSMLPAQVLDMPRRPAWSDRAMHYAHAAAAALPGESVRCQRLARGIVELMAASDPGPIVPTHGDFYEANVFLDRRTGRVSGLIDVDSVGPGHRVDDLACLLGHVSVLPHLAPAAYPHVAEELPMWVAIAERDVDPIALNARCAGVALSLVAGAKRTDGRNWLPDAQGRLESAEAWLERAYSYAGRRH